MSKAIGLGVVALLAGAAAAAQPNSDELLHLDHRPVEYLEGLRVNTAVPRSMTFSLSRSLP